MDKIAANNHFVALKKEIKKAKAMVSGNLIRKISKNKLEKEKIEDDEMRKKIDNKNSTILDDIKLIKTLDSYKIAKLATLKPDPKAWDKLISDSKATPEMRLIARIICKNNVQKRVAQFRSDNPECDEWLEEYIEYREKKRQLVETEKPKFKRKPKPENEKDKISKKNNSTKPQLKQKKPDRRRIAKNDPEENESKTKEAKEDDESLHPSWASKKKEKELLQAALSGEMSRPKRVVFES